MKVIVVKNDKGELEFSKILVRMCGIGESYLPPADTWWKGEDDSCFSRLDREKWWGKDSWTTATKMLEDENLRALKLRCALKGALGLTRLSGQQC